MKKFVSKESLTFGHSLITGNTPKKLSCDQVSEVITKESTATENFGLFETSATNYNTYYPDVTPEDLNPKDEDYVYPLFRALSNIIINKYGPIDFTDTKLLDEAKNKLIGLAVYTNHEMIVGNEIGVISEVSFQKPYKSKTGVDIPSGINVRLKLDGKSNPKIARAIMGTPPSIHSVSVTVEFEWEPSHKFADVNEFWRKLGTYTEDGELITRKVTEIKNFYEISLVSHGADPYAQVLDKDGNINNPGLANSRYQFSAEDYAERGHYFSYKAPDLISLTGTPEITIPKNINNKDNKNNIQPMNKEVKDRLIKKFSLKEESTDEEVIAKLEEVANNSTTLQEQINTLNATITEKENRIKELEPLSSVGQEVLSNTIKEATRLYQLHSGDKVNPKIVELIEKSDFNQATIYLEQYRDLVEEKFQGVCLDCKGHNVTRASSTKVGKGIIKPNEGGEGEGTTTIKSNDEVVAEIAKKNKASNWIH